MDRLRSSWKTSPRRLPEGSHYGGRSHRSRPGRRDFCVSAPGLENVNHETQIGFGGKQAMISGRHISHKAVVQQVSREGRAGPFVQPAETQSSLSRLRILSFRCHVVRLHANLQTRFFSSPSVANVHICFKVGRICPWVVSDLEEINPSGDSQGNKGGLTHSVLGQGMRVQDSLTQKKKLKTKSKYFR